MKSLPLFILALLAEPAAFPQDGAPAKNEGPRIVLKVAPPESVSAKIGGTVRVVLTVQVDDGYHVNSNTPAESFLIPLRLTWTRGPLDAGVVSFPKPEFEKLSFSQKPVSVFKGRFEIVTKFKVPSSASAGRATVSGKVHYQACNNRMCLPPRTIDVAVPLEIVR